MADPIILEVEVANEVILDVVVQPVIEPTLTVISNTIILDVEIANPILLDLVEQPITEPEGFIVSNTIILNPEIANPVILDLEIQEPLPLDQTVEIQGPIYIDLSLTPNDSEAPSESSQLINIQFPYNIDYDSLHYEFTRAGGFVTRIDYWEDDTKTNKLYEKVFNRTGAVLNSIVLTDLKNTLTYTKTFNRDIDDLLLSIDKLIN